MSNRTYNLGNGWTAQHIVAGTSESMTIKGPGPVDTIQLDNRSVKTLRRILKLIPGQKVVEVPVQEYRGPPRKG